jgi:methionyl-tRNA formyltransferase
MSDAKSKLNIIFAGTPEFSVPPLQALIDSEHQVVAVYTQPDRPAGRGRKLKPGSVKQLALDHDIPVYQPLSLKNEEAQKILIDHQADLMVVVAYGLILPLEVLQAPVLGCINIHASLLPRWRGAAPIQRAILAGDKETGITIMQMDIGLDTGDMLLKKTCPIETEDTGSSLHDRLSVMGADALIEALPMIISQTAQPEPQNNDDANYAEKLNKAEALLDWQQSAESLRNKINAFNAWPVAQTEIKLKDKIQMLRVWQAEVLSETSTKVPGTVLKCDKHGIDVATVDHVLRLLSVQVPGGKPMQAHAFVNAHDITGVVLGSPETI